MRIFEEKVNFLIICFKFCSCRIPLVVEDRKKRAGCRVHYGNRGTLIGRDVAASLHFTRE